MENRKTMKSINLAYFTINLPENRSESRDQYWGITDARFPIYTGENRGLCVCALPINFFFYYSFFPLSSHGSLPKSRFQKWIHLVLYSLYEIYQSKLSLIPNFYRLNV